jgi:C-terminal processing protease CtpA/Prc
VVNSGCASDCELMLELLASLPETLIVGANTYGMSQFIQPGYSILPRTGLEYRIALGTSNIYGDNRSLDGYGLDVDVVLSEVDALKPQQLRGLAQVVAGYE